MRALLILVPLVLAACASMPAPEPQGASLSETALTVKLSDGTRCTADWSASGGQGQMDGCAVPLSYSVTEVANPNILRKLWVQLTDALGATSVMVTHDVHESLAVVDYVYFMSAGRVVGEGTPGEIRVSTDPYVYQFVHAQPDGPVHFHYPASDLDAQLLESA